MRVWRKVLQWFRPPQRRPATTPEHAIVIARPDGTPYMHMWLDTALTESRVCMVFGGNLSGYKIMWSAHTLPQMKTAIEQLLRVPHPPVKSAGQNS